MSALDSPALLRTAMWPRYGDRVGDGEVDLVPSEIVSSGATVQVAGPQHAGLKEESRLFHGRPVPGGRRSPRDGRSGVKGLFPAPRDPATDVLEWDAQDSLWWLENHCGF